MSGTDLAALMETAARAKRRADEAREYLDTPPPDKYGVQVEWTWGGSNALAYVTLRDAVSRNIEARMATLLAEAASELQLDANEALRKVGAAMGTHAP